MPDYCKCVTRDVVKYGVLGFPLVRYEEFKSATVEAAQNVWRMFVVALRIARGPVLRSTFRFVVR